MHAAPEQEVSGGRYRRLGDVPVAQVHHDIFHVFPQLVIESAGESGRPASPCLSPFSLTLTPERDGKRGMYSTYQATFYLR